MSLRADTAPSGGGAVDLELDDVPEERKKSVPGDLTNYRKATLTVVQSCIASRDSVHDLIFTSFCDCFWVSSPNLRVRD